VQSRQTKKPPFTVRKVTDNHWGLVYMGCPARAENGQVQRFASQQEAEDMAEHLNQREQRISAFTSASVFCEDRRH
jgi:hypothetical protein